MFEREIIEALQKSVKGPITLEVPPDSTLGDFAFPCFALAKEAKKSPAEIAKDLAKQLTIPENVERIEAHGPYVNFFLDKEKIGGSVLNSILDKKGDFGKSNIGKEKTIVMEFPGPNTNKPLHLGHLRNMALGISMSNIFESQGYKVARVNINNDRGIHICQSMLAYQKWGEDKTPKSERRKSDHFIGDYYILFAKKVKENPGLNDEAQGMLVKWEAKDKEVRALWEKINGWALAGFDETYKHFDLPKFEKEYFESETYEGGKKIVLEGLKKGLFTKREDGAIVVDLDEEGLGEKVLMRADGTSVYVTQDLYLAQLKHGDFKFDKSVHVVATEQNYHFKVLFTLLKKLGYSWADNCHHFAYGLVLLPEGRMKSREGNVVDADDLILEMEDMAREEIAKRHKDLAEETIHERGTTVGLAAIKFYLLKLDAVKEITFHLEESISFEGDTGPYLQYTHARSSSIIRKAKEQNLTPSKNTKTSLLVDVSEQKVLKLLMNFPKKVEDAAAEYRPHMVAQYLIELGRAFNEFYHRCPCLQEKDKDLQLARLTLIEASRQVLENGLRLLGIKAPSEM